MSADDTIFVLIPCYRDAELRWTLKDMFAKAAYPSRLRLGICNQYNFKEDANCFVEYMHPKQTRVSHRTHNESKGANWARADAHRFYNGEKFTLVIDAHMRFVQDWDEEMIEQLRQCCGGDRAVLTVFPPKYIPPDLCEPGVIVRMGIKKFEDYAPTIPLLVYTAHRVKIEEAPGVPFKTATVSAGFMFARSEAFIECPFDPYIYFFWDEISLAARLWTHGWDLYSPCRVLVWHYWDREARPKHWDDHKNLKAEDDRTKARVAHLLRIESCDDGEVVKDLDKYGLGKVRTLEEFQVFSGVNYRKRTVAEFAQRGEFGA